MQRRPGSALVLALSVAAAGLVVTQAFAAPKDAAATKLDNDAMNGDYLNVNFAGAEAKLRKALNECGASNCDPKLKAKIQIHLGIILVNAGKAADATAAFAEGLKLDPTATPDKDFTTPDVTKAYDAAKGAGSAPPPATSAATPDKPPPAASSLGHDPVAEAPVNTPIPIFAEGGDSSVVRMVVNYKPFGDEWKKLELRKMGGGWGIEIPCGDNTKQGSIQYYLLALDNNGDPVGNAGTKKEPLKIQVKSKVDTAPHFPDKPAPDKCTAKTACPPGMTGPECNSEGLGYGSKCTGPNQCDKGLACQEGTCTPGSEDGSSDDSSSPGGDEVGKKNFFSFGISPDFAIVSGSDLCSESSQKAGTYTCFKSNGQQYAGNPGAGKGGKLSGFAQVGTVRFLVGYDRVVVNNLAIGARLGLAVGGGPKPEGGNAFLPFHGEVRGTYYFGKNVLAHPGFRPYVFASGGVAQVDAKIPSVEVPNDCANATHPNVGGTNAATKPATDANGKPTPGCSASNNIAVDAWKKLGTGFVSIGGGAMYAFTKAHSVGVDVKLAVMLGSSGVVISPTAQYQLGF